VLPDTCTPTCRRGADFNGVRSLSSKMLSAVVESMVHWPMPTRCRLQAVRDDTVLVPNLPHREYAAG